MRTKNIYTADLNLSDGESKKVTFSDDTSTRETLVTVTRIGDEYTVSGVESWDSELQNLIARRYKSKYFDLEGFDQRLRDMQYEIRKSLKEEGVEPVKASIPASPAPEAPQTPAQPAPEAPQPKEEKIEVEAPKLGLEGMIVQMVVDSINSRGSKSLIEQATRKMLDEWGIVPGKVEHVVKLPSGAERKAGIQHKLFGEILTLLSIRENLALVGPAGSGKTTTVAHAAKALDLPFYSKSVSAQTGVHEFFGYQDANGKYVKTLFREAYENGGVFLLDEFDAGNPNVLASMNQATANGHCAFADGMVEKHPDFVVVMAGNTFGHGATSEYVGRNKIDAATLDRFIFVDFGYDEDFEYQLASNKEWCKKVQALRKKAGQKKIKTIISPRATFSGEKLLKAGIAEERVMQLVIFKGLTQDEISMLN